MTELKRLHKKWRGSAQFRKAYDALNEEFALAQAMIEVLNRAGLTQTEVAKRIKTSQSVVARPESGSSLPSTRKRTAVREGYRFSAVDSL